MKKYFFILIFFLMAVSTQITLAKSYTVDSVDIKAALQEDGSAYVTETITMSFDGDFSRFIRDMPLSNEYFIEDISVAENGVEYKRLDAFDPSRPAGCYAVEEKDGKLVIEFYYKTEKETRSFEVSYLFENAVIVHNDVVELNRKFIDKGWDRIKKLDITVILPAGAQKKDIKVWSHGPLWGKADIISDSEVHYQIEGLPQDTFAEVRVTAPRSLFPDAFERQSGKEALSDIIAQEQKWADEANAERERRRLEAEEYEKSQNLWSQITIALVSINCVYAIYRAIKRRNKYKPKLSPQYYRDLPSDISPAELGELCAQGSGGIGKSISRNVNISSIYTATMLDLSLKNFLEIKKQASLGRKARPKDITVSLNIQDKDKSKLLQHELTLLNFIKTAIRDNPKGTMADVEKYAKKSEDTTSKPLTTFRDEVKKLIKEKNYLADRKISVIPLLYFIFAVTASIGIAFMLESEVLILISCCQLFFFAFAGIFGASGLSQKGIDEMALWQGFKNFLNDFTLFDEKELPELVIWQKYLVYATVLGEAQALLRQLPLIYPQLADPDYLEQNNELWLLSALNDENNNFFEVFNSVGSEMNQATRVAASSDSSGSGGGGGSSGGNSGGSSGGGGRAD